MNHKYTLKHAKCRSQKLFTNANICSFKSNNNKSESSACREHNLCCLQWHRFSHISARHYERTRSFSLRLAHVQHYPQKLLYYFAEKSDVNASVSRVVTNFCLYSTGQVSQIYSDITLITYLFIIQVEIAVASLVTMYRAKLSISLSFLRILQ